MRSRILCGPALKVGEKNLEMREGRNWRTLSAHERKDFLEE